MQGRFGIGDATVRQGSPRAAAKAPRENCGARARTQPRSDGIFHSQIVADGDCSLRPFSSLLGCTAGRYSAAREAWAEMVKLEPAPLRKAWLCALFLRPRFVTEYRCWARARPGATVDARAV